MRSTCTSLAFGSMDLHNYLRRGQQGPLFDQDFFFETILNPRLQGIKVMKQILMLLTWLCLLYQHYIIVVLMRKFAKSYIRGWVQIMLYMFFNAVDLIRNMFRGDYFERILLIKHCSGNPLIFLARCNRRDWVAIL